MFALYAVASLVPVLVLGIALANSFRSETNHRGLDEGRAQAQLIARTAVEPQLSGRPLSQGLSAAERSALTRLAAKVIPGHAVLRLRVRDLRGRVIFSDDGSGFGGEIDDEALHAAAGRTIAHLTRLNTDANDSGPRGTAAVEVYLPLVAGVAGHRVGVLEIYVPYAPISRELAAGLHRLITELVLGLSLLYVVLFGISASLSRVLRREAALNAFLAEHDLLTSLPNRTRFARRAASAIEVADGGPPVTVAILDLDRFKDVNDTLGHESGDTLLIELAGRLSGAAGPEATVARLGGDEFGVILTGHGDPEPALQRLLDAVDDEIEVNGLPLSVQASLGYATAPGDGRDVEQLLQRADVAMYAAKAQHCGVMHYEPALDQYDAESLALVAQLRRAIDQDQLVLHYQPQVDPGSGAVQAFEALVRWQHPELGLLYPDRFLPLAEQTDVIERLTSWVLARALADSAELDAAQPGVSVAVNISARTVGRASFAGEVIELLAATGVPGERLIIEVTETALLTDPNRAAQVLQALADAGVGVSLDDFGRGQTSLGYLSTLPLDELKIDRSFIVDLLDTPAHAAIVRSMLELGHNLGLRVVGEGIETAEVRRYLASIGCDLIQGYLLARPMPLAAAVAWLRSPAGVVA